MKYEFTERTRAVLARARDHSLRLAHDYMGTEHILLGLLETEGAAAAVLSELRVRKSEVRALIEESVRVGRATVVRGELPYTSRGKKVLEYAMATSREIGAAYVGTEHLLIGLLEEEKGIGAQVMNASGVTIDDVYGALARLSGQPVSDDGGPLAAPPSRPRAGRASRLDKLAARSRMVRLVSDLASGDRSGAVPDAKPVWFLELDASADTPIYEQIIAGIEEAVATNRVEVGERLPTVRQLAEELVVAPGTVARAYSRLEKNGVLETEGARGTRVAARTPAAEPVAERASALEQSLRTVVVQAYHLGASADELRTSLEKAMAGIYAPDEEAG